VRPIFNDTRRIAGRMATRPALALCPLISDDRYMKSHVRAAVAASAISHATGRRVLSLYDHSTGSEVKVSASAIGNQVFGYDSDNGCEFGGEVPSLYHYGESAHLDLTPRGEGGYGGYDHGSAAHFDVRVTGRDAQVYDYESNQWFAFSARAPETAATGY
jgi:hypothetical protein